MQTGVRKLPPYTPIPTSSLCSPPAHSPLPCEGKIPRLVGEAEGGAGRLEVTWNTLEPPVRPPQFPFLPFPFLRLCFMPKEIGQ